MMDCPYCGRTGLRSGGVAHIRVCMDGPMGERVKRWLQRVAVDGRLCTTHYYQANKDRDMPSAPYVQEQIGQWNVEVAAWAGLRWEENERSRVRRQLEREAQEAALPEVEFVRPAAPLGVEACAWMRKQIYDWRRRCYVVTDAAVLR